MAADGLATYLWFAALMPLGEGIMREPASWQTYALSGLMLALMFLLGAGITHWGWRLDRPIATVRR